MNPKLVVWDWNGTLLDDVDIIVQSVNSTTIPIYGLPTINVGQYQDNFEVPIKNWYLKMGASIEALDKRTADAAEAFERVYEAGAIHAPTRKGARQLLSLLNQRGLQQIILSNHTLEGIYLQLARLDLEQYMGHVLANDNIRTSHHKGKQDRLQQFLEQTGHAPASAVIVGDTIEEIAIGKNLGLKTIAITGGACSESRLQNAGPDRIVHSLDEIAKIVEELA